MNPPAPPGLPELNLKLRTSREFAETWTYFLDHFVDRPGFIDLGTAVAHPLVTAVVTQVCAHLLPGEKVEGLLLVRIESEKFLHGNFRIAGRLGGVFYFDDGDTGLMALTEMSGKTQFARFSLKQLRGIPDPSPN